MAWAASAGNPGCFRVSVSASAETAAKPGLEIGFGDSLLGASEQSVRDLWLDRTVDARAGLVRVKIGWRDVTSSEPGDPTDAGDLAYDFANLDAAIESVTQRGMVPLLTVFRAPPRAESGKSGAAGTRKPGPARLADFTTAIARRYSGASDPGGGALPRVRYFQLWNEPNLSTYLSPQWKGRKLVAATHYRRMLNAGFDVVKSVPRIEQGGRCGHRPLR